MIRPAETGDAPAIARLWNWMIRDTLATFTTLEKTPVDILAMLEARPGAFFVAEERGALSGFVTFGPFRSGPGYAATCEHSVIVDPKAQGRGVGHDLMAQAEAAARALGQHVMVAAISGANPGAVRFHHARGFRETGRMPQVGRKAGQWLDLVLMQKTLSAPS